MVQHMDDLPENIKQVVKTKVDAWISEPRGLGMMIDDMRKLPLDLALIAAAEFGARAALAAMREETLTSDATIDVLTERHRQVTEEGWTSAYDDLHIGGQLALAGAAYAYASANDEGLRAAFARPTWFPFEAQWWKPTTPRRDLVKAGALILAEIERLDRAVAPPTGQERE